VTKLTKEAFEKEISHLIEGNIDKMVYNLDPETKNKLVLFTKMVPLDRLIKKYEEPSDYVEEHNNWVKLSAMAIALIGVVVLALLIYLLYNTCGQCIPLNHLLMENAIVFIFVGIVEYLFFTRVAMKFIPAPPSLLVTSLVNKFKGSLEEHSL
jgi:hypothetical protein